jgi:hypothetical protein
VRLTITGANGFQRDVAFAADTEPGDDHEHGTGDPRGVRW